jgi:hypothetical protein
MKACGQYSVPCAEAFSSWSLLFPSLHFRSVSIVMSAHCSMQRLAHRGFVHSRATGARGSCSSRHLTVGGPKALVQGDAQHKLGPRAKIEVKMLGTTLPSRPIYATKHTPERCHCYSPRSLQYSIPVLITLPGPGAKHRHSEPAENPHPINVSAVNDITVLAGVPPDNSPLGDPSSRFTVHSSAISVAESRLTRRLVLHSEKVNHEENGFVSGVYSITV